MMCTVMLTTFTPHVYQREIKYMCGKREPVKSSFKLLLNNKEDWIPAFFYFHWNKVGFFYNTIIKYDTI